MTHAETQRRREKQPELLYCFSASLRLCVILLLAASCAAAFADGEPPLPAVAEPADESSQYAVETLAADLDNPCGLVLRPGAPAGGPHELFFSNSGAGEVVRVSTDNPAVRLPVVTGFPLGKLALDGPRSVGPLGLEFLTRTKLVVGTGDLGPGRDLIHVYALPADAAPLAHDAVDHTVGPVSAEARSQTGEGVFFALARIEDELDKALYATSAGDADAGWVLKASMAGNKLADLQPFIATRRVTGAAAPSAITVNPKAHAHYLVIGQRGEPGAERDSRLAFYGPSSGTPALVLNLGLYDVLGLAYSPGGELFALDDAAADPAAGGVYRIDAAMVDGRQSTRAVKIAAIERPTSLTFTPDGALYVTAFGQTASENPTGQLVKITPKGREP